MQLGQRNAFRGADSHLCRLSNVPRIKSGDHLDVESAVGSLLTHLVDPMP